MGQENEEYQLQRRKLELEVPVEPWLVVEPPKLVVEPPIPVVEPPEEVVEPDSELQRKIF